MQYQISTTVTILMLAETKKRLIDLAQERTIERQSNTNTTISQLVRDL